MNKEKIKPSDIHLRKKKHKKEIKETLQEQSWIDELTAMEEDLDEKTLALLSKLDK
jgi:hypothetical protein